MKYLVAVLALFSASTLALPGRRACAAEPVNQATLDLIKSFESWSATVYDDPDGNPTVGWGHLCSDSSCSGVKYKIPLSKSDGEKLLQDDLKTYTTCLSKDLKDSVKLNPNQYGALVSWGFNVGCGNVGSSTLVKRLNKGEKPNTVASEELPKWNRGNNGPLPGLTRRRKEEVALFKKAADGVAHPPSC